MTDGEFLVMGREFGQPPERLPAVCSGCGTVGDGWWPGGWVLSGRFTTGFLCPVCMAARFEAERERPLTTPDQRVSWRKKL